MRIIRMMMFLSIVLFGVVYGFTYIHETTHKALYEYYDVPAEIHIGLFDSYTSANSTALLDLYENYPVSYLILEISEDMVDVYGYQLMYWAFILFIVLLFIAFLLFQIHDTMLMNTCKCGYDLRTVKLSESYLGKHKHCPSCGEKINYGDA